jgi:hypothetical protein
MSSSDNDNISGVEIAKMRRNGLIGAAVLLAMSATALWAQGAGESLGPKDAKHAKGPAPLAALEAGVIAKPRPELMGVHPRVYFTAA